VTPETFPKAFAAAFSARDAEALAGMMTEDAALVSLTGQWVEGRTPIRDTWAAEFAGTLRMARLVTGRQRIHTAGQAAVVSQRFVLSGALAPDGREMPRCAVLLQGTLAPAGDGWHAVSISLTVLSD
jgi:uncharacterized protein (TIGR02246 family)